MKNKINIAKLLKDYPRDMELDCTMYENVYFDYVDSIGGINCYIKSNDGCLTRVRFLENGCYTTISNAKCVIFPKGKTTWEGFQRPFEDGDIISNGNYVAIFYKIGTPDNCKSPNVVYYHCYYSQKFCHFKKELDFGIGISTEFKYATEEEKQKLFDAIKANGYKWNPETKTLEKLPKFKVGNRVKSKINQYEYKIIDIRKDVYIMNYANDKFAYHVPFCDEDNFSLVPNKFDITTLIPYESRVLVRNDREQYWIPAFWGCKHADGYTTTYGWCKYCIPYEGNEYLLKTNNDCDNYYKTWE